MTPFVELPIGLFAASVLVAASRPERSSRLRALLGSRPLAFVGIFSFSLYLIHAPLLQAEWQYGLRPLHLSSAVTLALLALVGVPVVIAAAHLFFRLCEQPFMSSRRRPATARQ